MSQFLVQNVDLLLRLLIAAGLGMVIGVERILVHKEAGMKTHALVSLGAAVFIIISEFLVVKYMYLQGLNPTMIAAQIVVGIGFLGAGSIILQGNRLLGLTTAGGLWVTASIGMAVGFGLYALAVTTTVIVLFVLTVVNVFEKPLRKISENIEHPEV